jgi:hypothetical protein
MVSPHAREVRERKHPKPDPDPGSRNEPAERLGEWNRDDDYCSRGNEQRENDHPVMHLPADHQAPARSTRLGAVKIDEEKSASRYGIAAMGTRGVTHRRLTDQPSTAARAPSRVEITRTVPPGRSVALRGYAAADRSRAISHSTSRVQSQGADDLPSLPTVQGARPLPPRVVGMPVPLASVRPRGRSSKQWFVPGRTPPIRAAHPAATCRSETSHPRWPLPARTFGAPRRTLVEASQSVVAEDRPPPSQTRLTEDQHATTSEARTCHRPRPCPQRPERLSCAVKESVMPWCPPSSAA